MIICNFPTRKVKQSQSAQTKPYDATWTWTATQRCNISEQDRQRARHSKACWACRILIYPEISRVRCIHPPEFSINAACKQGTSSVPDLPAREQIARSYLPLLRVRSILSGAHLNEIDSHAKFRDTAEEIVPPNSFRSCEAGQLHQITSQHTGGAIVELA